MLGYNIVYNMQHDFMIMTLESDKCLQNVNVSLGNYQLKSILEAIECGWQIKKGSGLFVCFLLLC